MAVIELFALATAGMLTPMHCVSARQAPAGLEWRRARSCRHVIARWQCTGLLPVAGATSWIKLPVCWAMMIGVLSSTKMSYCLYPEARRAGGS